ncbi:PAS domain-containing protein, partial [bacterium]|nr:PAS domain-containing protein [bacterium]
HAAELELRVAERTAELKQANARLAGIFRSAMDAFVVLDTSRRVLIFNPAAEKMFRCSAAEVAGEPVDRLLAPELAALLEHYITSSGSPAQMWLPDGLHARRKSGELFLIEGSLSRAASGSGDLFTIILRDINELEHLLSQNVYLRQEIQSELNFEEIVGASPAIERVFQSIE